MASPSHTAGQCRTKSDNTNSASTSTPPPLQRTTSKLDCSSLSKPPTSPINEPQRPSISSEVVRGLHLLSLDMPQAAAAKVVAAYTNLLPMERFLAETCGIDGGAPLQDVVGSSKTSSCEVNAGSFKSE